VPAEAALALELLEAHVAVIACVLMLCLDVHVTTASRPERKKITLVKTRSSPNPNQS
jgi:hypothetical protein